jgi:hypothetical protein
MVNATIKEFQDCKYHDTQNTLEGFIPYNTSLIKFWASVCNFNNVEDIADP